MTERQKKYAHRRRLRSQIYLIRWFKAHPCVDCGESDILKLQPDHVRGEKEFTIGCGARWVLIKIKNELAKCESRCANCHWKRHNISRDSFKLRTVEDLQKELKSIITSKPGVHINAKLTLAQAESIRAQYAINKNLSVLAREYNVAIPTISNIVKGNTYKGFSKRTVESEKLLHP